MNPNQTGARRAAEPATTTPKPLQRLAPIVTHPYWIGLILCGMATVCGWSTMIVAAVVANWLTR